MKKSILFISAIFLACLACYQAQATIYYVRTTGLTSNDGLTWASSTSIQRAFVLAAVGDTILVAKGTYKTDTLGVNRNATFLLKNKIVFIGGYNNVGNPAFGNRNATANVTILSGDLSNNDNCATMSTGGSAATYIDNAYHVVRIPATIADWVYVEGFTISGGSANGAAPDNQGAGILVEDGAKRIQVISCIISCNFSSSDGAGISHRGTTNSNLILRGCTVTQNVSNIGDGGGILVRADSASISRSTISLNRGSSGGGLSVKIANAANCVYSILNNTFENNLTTLAGGAINLVNGANEGYVIDGNNFVTNTSLAGGAIGFFGTTTGVITYIQSNKFVGNIASGQGGGAIFISNVSLDANGTAQSTILNNVFSGNRASANAGTNGKGGAISIQGLTATQKAPVIANNTFSRNLANGNNAAVGGGALFVSGNDAAVNFTVFNNIFWNNTNTGNRGNNLFVATSTSFKYAHSIINVAEGTCTGGCQDTGVAALINKDPKFYDDDGADNTAGTLDDDLRLQYDNTVVLPFIYNHAFDTGVYTYNTFTTLNVDYLVFDRTCLPDLGAYEYTHYWKGGTTDWNVGANWSDKCGNIVPTAKMNIYVGTDDQSSTNATGGITGTNTPTTPLLDVTNHVGFSMYVNNDVTMQANTLITLQGHLRVGGSARFNNSAVAYGGRVLMKPTDCSYAQTISHNGNQCNFNHLEIDNAANVSKTGNNVNIKTVVEMTNGNLAVNGGFTLLSTATGTAMVANEPAAGVSPTTRRITGIVTVQRHITGHPTGFTGIGYHYFSSPVAAAPISQFNTVMNVIVGNAYYWYNPTYLTSLGNFPNFYYYQEGNNTDDGTNTGGFEGGASPMGGWRSFASTGVNMGIGTGYCVHIQQGLTPTFRGTLNNGTYTTTVTKTGAAPFSGWNLVGNPYPSPLDWDMVHAANSGVLEATLYRRIPKGTLNIVTFSKYTAGLGLTEIGGGTVGGAFVGDATANVDKNIALGQGFFVVAKGNGNVTVTNAMRPTVATQSQPLFLRTEGETKPMAVKLRFQNSQYYDEMAVHFKEGSTSNFDGDVDARKGIPNGGQMPDMYMLTADAKQVSINGLPIEMASKGIPFVVQPKTNGDYEIKLTYTQALPAGTSVFVWDKELNIKQLLTEKQSYKCNLQAKTYTSRFELLFDLPIDQKLNNTVSIYPNPNENSEQATLRFLSNNQATLKISVYDLTGRLIKTQTVEKQLNTFETTFSTKELPVGVYMVEVHDGNKGYTTKFVK
jgi:hypothetical protein